MVEVLIVGAGLSGITAGYYCDRNRISYVICEINSQIGGTWATQKFPGIRADSLHIQNLFSFYPAAVPSVTSGEGLRQYIEEVANHFKISSKIRFYTKVVEVNWLSDAALWEATLIHKDELETARFSFVINGNGYFDLLNPHVPKIFQDQANRFKGKIVHSSKLSSSDDLKNKDVCLVGSGATATTMVPALLKASKRLTWCIRSSSHTIPLFRYPWIFEKYHNFLVWLYHKGIRLPYRSYRNLMVFWIQLFIQVWVHYLPKWLQAWIYRKWNGTDDVTFKKYFKPEHALGEQRLCLFEDMYKCLESPKMNMYKGAVTEILPDGLKVNENKVEAETIVLATGYDLSYFKFGVKVDGKQLNMSDQIIRREYLFEHIPNLFIITLFNRLTPKTTTSSTPNMEIVSKTICTLIRYMRKNGYKQVMIQPTKRKVNKIVPMSARYITRNTDKCFYGIQKEADEVCSWKYMFFEQPFHQADFEFN